MKLSLLTIFIFWFSLGLSVFASPQQNSDICSDEWIPLRVVPIFDPHVTQPWRDHFIAAATLLKDLIITKKRTRDIRVPRKCESGTRGKFEGDVRNCEKSKCLQEAGCFGSSFAGSKLIGPYLAPCTYLDENDEKVNVDEGGMRISDADLAIFVFNLCQTNPVAQAWRCHLEEKPDRGDMFPHCGNFMSLGVIELNSCIGNRGYISVDTVIHEVMHVINFVGQLKNSKTMRIRNMDHSVISGPNLLEAIRSHVGCPKIDGVPVTDGGHLSMEFVGMSLLVASRASYDSVFISPVTIAGLKDLGFKINDVFFAEKYQKYFKGSIYFGKNKGCNFWEGHCTAWLADKRNQEFCSPSSQPQPPGCVSHHRQVAECPILTGGSNTPECLVMTQSMGCEVLICLFKEATILPINFLELV